MKENENGALNDAVLDGVAGGGYGSRPHGTSEHPVYEDGSEARDPCPRCRKNRWYVHLVNLQCWYCGFCVTNPDFNPP